MSEDKLPVLEKKQIKWYLRRIEHEIERDEASTIIVTMLREGTILTNLLFEIIDNDIYYKCKTLNSLAVSCHTFGLYEHVIPFLEKSLEIEPENEDSLYNLGTLLYQFQQFTESLNFLRQIKKPDQTIIELIHEIEVKINESQ